MANSKNADSKFIWMEGKLIPYAEAVVPVLSHSLHYGTGAFEGIRAYQTADGNTAIFRAADHLKRLIESASCLGCTVSHSIETLMKACCETIKANELKECYVRPLVYLDDSVRGLKLPSEPKMLTAIAVWPWGKYMGDEGIQAGIRVMTSTYRRADVASSLPWAKLTGAYVTSVLARREATFNGLDEAVLLDPLGNVAEGSGENIFAVKDGVLYTPPATYILPGLTRDSLLKIAHTAGREVKIQAMTRNQLYLADEVFFTGTAAEITPIREIDHHKIGNGQPGPVTKALTAEFFKCVRGQSAEHQDWLTKVY